LKLASGVRLNGHPSGRHFLQIPGPTNVPDRILRALDYPTIDHRGPEFAALGLQVIQGMQRIFKTQHPVIIYPASGTGAWEAALVNTLSPGDTVLMAETGHFSTLWNQLATQSASDQSGLCRAQRNINRCDVKRSRGTRGNRCSQTSRVADGGHH